MNSLNISNPISLHVTTILMHKTNQYFVREELPLLVLFLRSTLAVTACVLLHLKVQ